MEIDSTPQRRLLSNLLALLDRPLALPALDDGLTVATITRQGLRLAMCRGDGADVCQVNVAGGSSRCGPAMDACNALPKPVADCLCMAVLHRRRSPPESDGVIDSRVRGCFTTDSRVAPGQPLMPIDAARPDGHVQPVPRM